MKKCQDQCQSDQDLVRRCRLGIQCRPGKMQHDDDPRKEVIMIIMVGASAISVRVIRIEAHR